MFDRVEELYDRMIDEDGAYDLTRLSSPQKIRDAFDERRAVVDAERGADPVRWFAARFPFTDIWDEFAWIFVRRECRANGVLDDVFTALYNRRPFVRHVFFNTKSGPLVQYGISHGFTVVTRDTWHRASADIRLLIAALKERGRLPETVEQGEFPNPLCMGGRRWLLAKEI